jgi:hypothetical protein
VLKQFFDTFKVLKKTKKMYLKSNVLKSNGDEEMKKGLIVDAVIREKWFNRLIVDAVNREKGLFVDALMRLFGNLKSEIFHKLITHNL